MTKGHAPLHHYPGLDPWENGKSYWNTGHFHQAVMQAAIRVNAETQAKLGRMVVSETALFKEAFSLSRPKEDSPRFRLMEDDGSRTYENLHRGARAFAEGLYAGSAIPACTCPTAVAWSSSRWCSSRHSASWPAGSTGLPSWSHKNFG
ncbi:TIGR02391 family protein [Dermacoccus abyssi]|uniref:TIGR02391 family protein n=1 Tax=Dermacoccus abyssi TaxID=322596 RepID=UPI003899690F